MEADPWSVLGLEPSATYEQAKQAYRRRSRLLHPDRHPEADAELRKEAERAMADLSHAWQTVALLLSEGVSRDSTNATQTSSTSDASETSDDEASQPPSGDAEFDDLDTPQECLDWVLGALVEGGRLQGDSLSASEIARVLQPISKEMKRSSFDVWLAHRTTTMRAALDADRPDKIRNLWVHCYELLDEAGCDKVIMMMLDELLDDESKSE